jgi:quercetin dioxygenase-like cupin family protein
MNESVLQSPDLTLKADSNEVVNYKRDPQNYITQLFAEQFPAIKTGLFNVHMSKGTIIQPHWHTNVTETVFVVSGKVKTSVFNPFTRELMTYKLRPGQVSVFPKGWFHWIVAKSDNVHILTIFDRPTPDIVYGSDFLRATPKEIMRRAYGVNEEDYANAVAPIQESVIFGPPFGDMKYMTQQDVSWPGEPPGSYDWTP